MAVRCLFALSCAILLAFSTADARLLHGSTTYEGFVATRARMLNTNTASSNQLMCRTAYVATRRFNQHQGLYSDMVSSGCPAGGEMHSQITLGIEYNGTTTEVTFSGAGGAKSIADNSVTGSDYITIPKIPAGATFYGRQYWTGSAGVYFNGWQSSALSESCSVAVSGLSDQSQGTGAVTGGTPSAFSYPFLAIVAHTIKPSVLIIGDSRAANVNCSGSIETDCDGKQGNIAASMGSVPFVDVAQFGQEANGYSAGAGSAIFGYGSQVIVELGINDLNCSTGGSCASPDPRNPTNGYGGTLANLNCDRYHFLSNRRAQEIRGHCRAAHKFI